MADQTGRDSDKFMLRLPNGMRDRIKIAAEKNSRSMNAEIVQTLEDAYPNDGPWGPDDILQIITGLGFYSSDKNRSAEEEKEAIRKAIASLADLMRR